MGIEKKIAGLRECMVQLQDEEDQLRWDETLIALLDGVSEKDERIMKPVLQQQWDYLHGCKKHDRWGEYSHNGVVSTTTVPTVRRIFDDFPIRHLVGVQPVSELIGTVFGLECRYVVDDKSKESPFGTGKRLENNVIGHKVEVGARKLNAAWKPATKEEVAHQRGIDIECEMIQALSQEIRADITNEVLCDLIKLGGEPEVVKSEGSKTEQIKVLGCRIRANCSAIAMTTRRGHGNWIVVSSTMAKVLSKEPCAKIEFKDDYKSKNSEMLEVGTMNDVIRIFVADVPDDEILVGYKGANGECDSGYFYCPHTPMMSGGFTIDPNTFNPSMSFHTRYGKFASENAGAYYRNIKIESDLLIKKK